MPMIIAGVVNVYALYTYMRHLRDNNCECGNVEETMDCMSKVVSAHERNDSKFSFIIYQLAQLQILELYLQG